MNEWSIGFDVITATEEVRDSEEIFHLKECRLWEYSPVTWGANPATTTLSGLSINHPQLYGLLDQLVDQNPGAAPIEIIERAREHLSVGPPSSAPNNKEAAVTIAELDLLLSQNHNQIGVL